MGADTDLESTATLLARVRDGDEDARERLVVRYLALLQWAHGRVPPRARRFTDTDDLVQTTLLRALGAVSHFEPRREGAFLAYLRTILLNQLRTAVARVDAVPPLRSLPESLEGAGPSPLEQAIGSEAMEAYEAALASLTEDQRQAVVLRIEMGLSFQEVAEATESPSAVPRGCWWRAGWRGSRSRWLRARDEDALLRLAKAVAEGSAVDWARELAAQPELGRELEQLRALEAIAALPRNAAADPLVGRELSHQRIRERPGRLFSPGQILGNRYQVRAFLGEGGMGEVWLASDLRLRVEVALKSVRRERLRDERALERLRQEVRAAREVASPNVCRIFDLMEVDGQELVSMEYVDGTTLAEVLRQRGPLELREASEIASHFLAGLEAIHRAGLVHRDVKPENLMLTRTGRVVLMDFGLAKPEGEQKSGIVSGTPAYMAPEQARGERLDARADLFAAGVVLAEMTDPAVSRDAPSRKAFLRGIHEEPPRLCDTPWRRVLLQAVARDPAQRPASAHALTRALEEVSLRVAGGEDLRPYPGLAPFSAADAEFFFGRELEVEQMCRRLRWPHLQAIIGPSGAGKSSFLHAGLIPALPEGWRCVACTPGRSPMLALAQALAPELSGDTEAVQELLRFEDPDAAVKIVSRWRRRCAEAVVVVDQFEELFTQNPPERQARFADLLGRLALEADVHVLLSMRDDFLFHCHAQPALAPIFSELLPLGPLAGAALHRALVQPALRCGYRFEDEAFVEEMLAELKDERGALPLLAFAAARMWEKRDRETGFLTRAVYREIGGVAGALAQHAETTLERIGAEPQPLVREIFRNLITSQGTRVARDREELLSVFPDREQAEQVLRALVDARLLTSFEVREGEAETSRSSQRVEVIHESLLVAWPRIVRWQTQDADGALLRDQLRQAAQMWEERGRPADLLWTGASYREFQVWRERYPGGLTATEEAFAKAMTARAGRLRQRRRLAVAAALALLLGVISVVTRQEREATLQKERAEHRQAEAQREGAKTAIAREEPFEARALLRASLEIEDSPLARALWSQLEGNPLVWERAIDPIYNVAVSPDGRTVAAGGSAGLHLLDIATRSVSSLKRAGAYNLIGVAFSPDGRLVASGSSAPEVLLWDVETGSSRALVGHTRGSVGVAFSRDGRWLASTSFDGTVRVWDVRTGECLKVLSGHDAAVYSVAFSADGRTLYSGSVDRTIRVWDIASATCSKILADHTDIVHGVAVSPDGSRLLSAGVDRTARLWRLPEAEPERALDGHSAPVARAVWSPDGRRIVTADWQGRIRIWDAATGSETGTLPGHADNIYGLAFTPDGRFLASGSWDGYVRLWSMASPRPPPVLVSPGVEARSVAFSPDGSRLAVGGVGAIRLLDPRSGDEIAALEGFRGGAPGVAFRPDGRILASGGDDKTVHLWDLTSMTERRALTGHSTIIEDVAFSPDGRRVASTSWDKTVRVWEVASGEETAVLRGHSGEVRRVAFSPDGRLLASCGFDATIRIWSTSAWREEKLLRGHTETVEGIAFTPDGKSLLSAGDRTVRVWDLTTGQGRILARPSSDLYVLRVDPRGEKAAVAAQDGTILVLDLGTGASKVFSGPTSLVVGLSFNPDGRSLAGSAASGVWLWDTATGRRIWRTGALLANPPELLTQRGWSRLDDSSTSVATSGSAWKKALEDRAVSSSQAPGGGLLCLRPFEDGIELWDTLSDRRLHQTNLGGVERVVAIPNGCVTLAKGEARLFDRSGRTTLLANEARAIAWAGNEILVAAAQRIERFDASGRALGWLPSGASVSALGSVAGRIAVGFTDGSVELFASQGPASTFPLSLQEAPASPVARIAEGPMQTLALGFRDGTVGLWSTEDGSRLESASLSGPVEHLLVYGNELYAASELGSYVTLDFSAYRKAYCDLLRDVWEAVPVLLERGSPVLREPPVNHPCRTSAGALAGR